MSYGDGPCLGGGFLLASDNSDAGAAMGASVVSQPSQGDCTCSPTPSGAPSPCAAPPGGPVPPNQPSSGQAIAVDGCSDQFGDGVASLTVTCAETGVSLVSSCSSAMIFYLYPVLGSPPFTFTSPGGIGFNCYHMQDFDYSTYPQSIRYGYQFPYYVSQNT